MEGGCIIQFGTPEDLHERPATPSVGAIFGGAQIVSAKREGDVLVTPLGQWPIACIAGDVPETGDIDLLVHAEALECIRDNAGLTVVDVHPLGVASRLTLQTRAGEEITVQTTAPVEEGARYRVVPRDGSVRAFSRN
jgi:iron(III) transport system ATP-binding protein